MSNDNRELHKVIRKRKDVTKIVLAVFCGALVVCIGVGLFGVVLFKQSKDQEIGRLNEIITLTNENNIIIPINDFQEYVTRYESVIRFSQRYFPEYFVYYGSKGIVFQDLNKDLVKNPYYQNEGNFVYQNKRLDYIDETIGYKSLQGIDISDHQGNINWSKVAKDGIDFAYIRVGYRGYSEGKIYEDSEFITNIEGAKKAGLKVGVYFFSGAITVAEAKAEAKVVLKDIKGYKIDYPIAFDMEVISDKNNRMAKLTVENRVAIAKAFCDTIEAADYQAMIYGNATWMVEKLDFPEVANYKVWYANWDYFTWPYEVAMYQYTSSGKVAGISTRVDMNIGFFNYPKEG